MGFGQPPGFGTGGYIDPLTGEFQPGTAGPEGTPAVWSKGINATMVATGGAAGMTATRGKNPTMATTGGVEPTMNPNA